MDSYFRSCVVMQFNSLTCIFYVCKALKHYQTDFFIVWVIEQHVRILKQAPYRSRFMDQQCPTRTFLFFSIKGSDCHH